MKTTKLFGTRVQLHGGRRGRIYKGLVFQRLEKTSPQTVLGKQRRDKVPSLMDACIDGGGSNSNYL